MIALIPPLNYLGTRDGVLSSTIGEKTKRRCQEDAFPIKRSQIDVKNLWLKMAASTFLD